MASHNIVPLPRTIASVLLDLHYARQDWDQAASNAIHRAEDADALIRRLLKEQAEAPKARAA